MSRTDKTNPFWVKLMHGDLAMKELHNHTDGVCDLPPINDAVAYTYGTTKCRREFVYTGIGTCGCWMCRSYDWPMSNRQANRKERRKRNREDRQLSREYRIR